MLVVAAIDRIDPRGALGQQHVGEAAGRASYIHRYGVIHVPAEMIQGVRQLDPAARNPGMIATPQFNRRIFGQRLSGLFDLSLARIDSTGREHGLRTATALDDTAIDSELDRSVFAHGSALE